MTRCCKCKENKPESEFYRNSHNANGLDSRCRVFARAWKIANRDSLKKSKRKWESKNVEHIKAYNRAESLRRHGITQEQFDELLDAQGGRCAICGTSVPGTSHRNAGRFNIDHDHDCCPGIHSCGKCIRGLLCVRCNRAIGLLRDDCKIVESALKYLERSR